LCLQRAFVSHVVEPTTGVHFLPHSKQDTKPPALLLIAAMMVLHFEQVTAASFVKPDSYVITLSSMHAMHETKLQQLLWRLVLEVVLMRLMVLMLTEVIYVINNLVMYNSPYPLL
jgi:hypothetical protein